MNERPNEYGVRLVERRVCWELKMFLTLKRLSKFMNNSAEVVKLVDAVDSKSTGFIARAGSSPAFGTIIFKGGAIITSFYFSILKKRHEKLWR